MRRHSTAVEYRYRYCNELLPVVETLHCADSSSSRPSPGLLLLLPLSAAADSCRSDLFLTAVSVLHDNFIINWVVAINIFLIFYAT